MVRELQGFKVHLIDGSEEARGDRRKLVGDGAELGGGTKRGVNWAFFKFLR